VVAQERPGEEGEELGQQPLAPVGIGERPGEQGVGEERTGECGADLGKVVWGGLADLIGDLYGKPPPWWPSPARRA
jgi:hypothetical protein